MKNVMSYLLVGVSVISLVPSGAIAARPREVRNDRHDQVVQAVTNWKKLGERWVDTRVDHDTIAVGADNGRYTKVMLKIEHSALEMFDIVITFADNTTFSPTTRLVFGQGTVSREIDLPGGARVIKKVDFKYRNLPAGGRAQVEFWAK